MDDTELRLAAFEAGFGAEDVRRRLDIFMQSGAPSIADLAYTIRLRVKEPSKIIAKVRRKQRRDPSYSVGRLRDIVGLRIVTLHRLDALDIIPKLFALVRENCEGSKSFFVSNRFEEIKIYSTNPMGDAQSLPIRLFSLFQRESLGDIASVEQKAENYSSIHMVTWCRGRHGDDFKLIPIEIQVRTAFEDSWAEIDHLLNYKAEEKCRSVRESQLIQSCLEHLRVMKIFIDGAAQYADQIKIQEQQINHRRFFSTTFRTIQDTSTILSALEEISDATRDFLLHGLDQKSRALSRHANDPKHKAMRIACLRVAESVLRQGLKSIEDMHGDKSDKLLSLQEFYIPMEIAISLFHYGRELDDLRIVADSVNMFQQLQDKHDVSEHRSFCIIIRYRYARALEEIGDRETAVSKYKEAQNLLAGWSDEILPKDHWIRVSLLRNLGVALWAISDANRHKASIEPDSEAYRATLRDDLERYLEALTITREALDLDVEPDEESSEYDIRTRYKGPLCNNIIYYAMDYLENGGKDSQLRELGYDSDTERTYLGIMLIDELEHVSVAEVLHTMLRASRRDDTDPRTINIAKRLQHLLTAKGVQDLGGESHDEEMLRFASHVLSAGDAAGPTGGTVA